jgi:hypothetical protein
MTREDERVFLDFVRSTGDVVTLPRISPGPDFQPLTNLPDITWPPVVNEWQCFLLNREVSSKVKGKRIERKDHYLLDSQASSVIEFWRTIVHSPIMYRGRVWASFNYFDEDLRAFSSKETAFEKWYERIAKWIKTQYRHVTLTATMGKQKWTEYLAPGILKFQEMGGMLAVNPLVSNQKKMKVYDKQMKVVEIPIQDF